MNTSIKVGDFIELTSALYQIRNIEENKLSISSVDNPDILLFLESFDDKWKIADTDIYVQPKYISREDYNLREIQASYLLSLPSEIIIMVIINLPITDLFNLCQVNSQINAIICQDNYFWKRKYNHDYGEPLEQNQLNIDWKLLFQKVGDVYLTGFGQIDFRSLNIKARKMACGNYHVMIIDPRNDLWGYGTNRLHQLGIKGKVVYVPTSIGIKAKKVSCGSYHTMIIDPENNIWGFGSNDRGQLGLGDTKIRKVPTSLGIKAKKISCGGKHTMFIDLEDNLWGMGDNFRGNLGLGDRTDRDTPTSIGLKAKNVTCGKVFTIVTDFDDKLIVFGLSDQGELGFIADFHVATPIYNNLTAKKVSCGQFHTMIIDFNDELIGFGNNKDGQLGLSDILPINLPSNTGFLAKDVSCGNNHTMVIDLHNNLWGFGNNDYFKLGLYTPASTIVAPMNYNKEVKKVKCGNVQTVIIV